MIPSLDGAQHGKNISAVPKHHQLSPLSVKELTNALLSPLPFYGTSASSQRMEAKKTKRRLHVVGYIDRCRTFFLHQVTKW